MVSAIMMVKLDFCVLVTYCVRLGLSPEGGLCVRFEWNNPRRMCYLEGFKSEWCTAPHCTVIYLCFDNLPMVLKGMG